jgi:uncharacterized protein (DUF1015 family)
MNVEKRLKMLQRWEGEFKIITKRRSTITREKMLHRKLHKIGEYFGEEWYPLYRKEEIIDLIVSKKIASK